MPTMRGPDGREAEVDAADVAALERDQGWTVVRDTVPVASPEPVIMKGAEGRLFEASPEEAELLARDQGMVPASPQEAGERREYRRLYSKYGSGAQQAVGLAETFLRNASLGVISGLDRPEDSRERAQLVSQDSPVAYGAAGWAPGIAAGLATGGAGLGVAGTLATEGVIGGLANVGNEQDAAFVEDRNLSAEAALGSFAKGAILGVGTTGALMGAGRLVGRNRFVEAAGRAERRAEKAAFRSRGIDNPVDGLGDAAIDPVKASKIREKGRDAAETARDDMASALDDLDQAEQAARRYQPPVSKAEGDPAAQRAAIRAELDPLRKDLEPIASPDERGVVVRAFSMLDRAETPDQLYDAVRTTRQVLSESLGGAGDAATAKALKKGVDRLEALESNSSLFGPVGDVSVKRQEALSQLAESRQMLHDFLGSHNYLELVGMRTAEPIENALDSYMESLAAVVRESPGLPEAKAANAAMARMRKLREGPLRKIAGLNQVDAISGIDPDDVRPQAPGAATAIMDMAEQAAKFGATPHYTAYKIAKMAWKARKLFSPETRLAAGKDLALEAAGMADPVVGPARLAWKYRHHIAVLAETARESAESAAKDLVGVVKKRGVGQVAEDVAEAVAGKEGKQMAARARKLGGQRGFVDLSNKVSRYDYNNMSKGQWQQLENVLPPNMTDEHIKKIMGIDRWAGDVEFFPIKNLDGDGDDAGEVIGLIVRNEFGAGSMRRKVHGVARIWRSFMHRPATGWRSMIPGNKTPRTVTHDEFFLPESERGVGKQIIKDSIDIYAETGISRVDIDMAIDVGRWLWPRMGFRPPVDVEERALEDFVGWLAFHKKDLDTADIMTLPDIARTPEGKEWLLSQNGEWNNNLSLEVESKASGSTKLKRQGGQYDPSVFDSDELDNISGHLAAPSPQSAKKYQQAGFTLPDIAKSPMGVVTALGGASLAARYASEKMTPESYAKVRAAVESILKEPGLLAERLANEMGDTVSFAPELVERVNERALAAVQFLASKIPPSFGFSLLYPDGPPPSRMDVTEMQLYMRGITDPEDVIRAIGQGTSMPEEVEALRAVHQSWFAELQRATHIEVAMAAQNGDVIPGARLANIEAVLDMPGQLDPTFSDQVSVAAQAQSAETQLSKTPSYTPQPKAGARIKPTGAP